MRLIVDRNRKLILLQWLKQGYIDTMDLPEAYKGGSYFHELLQESGMIDDGEADRSGTGQEKAP